MHTNVFRLYKDGLVRLERNKARFNLLEAESSVVGASRHMHISTLASELEEYVKAAIEFVSSPFEPATLDNLGKSEADLGSTLTVFESQPSDYTFDARDILDLKVLSDAVDTCFKCITAIEQYNLGEVRGLITLDSTIHEIIANALDALQGNSSPFPMMCGGEIVQPIITFKLLVEQKYYTQEEKDCIAESERRKLEAEEEAKRKAKLAELCVEAKNSFSTVFTVANGYKEDWVSLPEIVLYRAWSTFNKLYPHGFNEISQMEHIVNESITCGDMACVNKFISTVSKRTAYFRSQTTYDIFEDMDDKTVVQPGDILALIVEE